MIKSKVPTLTLVGTMPNFSVLLVNLDGTKWIEIQSGIGIFSGVDRIVLDENLGNDLIRAIKVGIKALGGKE